MFKYFLFTLILTNQFLLGMEHNSDSNTLFILAEVAINKSFYEKLMKNKKENISFEDQAEQPLPKRAPLEVLRLDNFEEVIKQLATPLSELVKKENEINDFNVEKKFKTFITKEENALKFQRKYKEPIRCSCYTWEKAKIKTLNKWWAHLNLSVAHSYNDHSQELIKAIKEMLLKKD